MNEPGRPSVLIVDDDKNNLLVLNDILESEYTVLTAKNGENGLRIASVHKPDIILLDIIMADMDGFDVLRQLKENEDLKNTPVIFITGLANAEDEEQGFSLGAADYITKPFRNTIVKARVQTQLKAVSQMRLIERSAMLDALTGIPNRRAYDYRLSREWGEAVRERKPLGLLLLDVDKFKGYNDNFGHPKGDDLLRSLAAVLNGMVKRPGDFAARIGGEEFAVILPNTELDGVMHIADRIRAHIQSLAIPHPDSTGSAVVTVSVGAGARGRRKGISSPRLSAIATRRSMRRRIRAGTEYAPPSGLRTRKRPDASAASMLDFSTLERKNGGVAGRLLYFRVDWSRHMQAQVALVMGSNSDLPKLEKAIDVFKEFGIGCEIRILSAHRTPHAVADFASGAKARGIKVIIAAAGGAAHLAGVIASFTVLPVIGVPIALPGGLGGLDSLLSMVQMPAGIPVATMSAGGGGAENAALMAVSILAVNDVLLTEMLESFRKRMSDKVLERDSALQWKLTAPDTV